MGNVYTGDSKQTFRNGANDDLTSSQLHSGEIRPELEKQEMEPQRVPSSEIRMKSPFVYSVFSSSSNIELDFQDWSLDISEKKTSSTVLRM